MLASGFTSRFNQAVAAKFDFTSQSQILQKHTQNWVDEKVDFS